MTIEEFSKELSKLLGEFLHGVNFNEVPVRLTFQLYEDTPDERVPLRVDLTLRRVWVK